MKRDTVHDAKVINSSRNYQSTMDNAPLVNNAEPIFPTVEAQPVPAYPQPVPAYPQPQPVYAQSQPVYAQPVYGQQPQQSIVADAEMINFFGYVKTIKTLSIVMIVCMCIAFPSLIFVWYPIIGLNVSKKWNESSFGCYYCFSWTELVCAVMSAVYYFFIVIGGERTLPDGTVVPGTYYLSTFISNLISAFVSYWILRLAGKIREGLKKYQIYDIMRKASFTKLFIESNVSYKCW